MFKKVNIGHHYQQPFVRHKAYLYYWWKSNNICVKMLNPEQLTAPFWCDHVIIITFSMLVESSQSCFGVLRENDTQPVHTWDSGLQEVCVIPACFVVNYPRLSKPSIKKPCLVQPSISVPSDYCPVKRWKRISAVIIHLGRSTVFMPVDPLINCSVPLVGGTARFRGQAVIMGCGTTWIVSTNRPAELYTETPPGQLASLLAGGSSEEDNLAYLLLKLINRARLWTGDQVPRPWTEVEETPFKDLLLLLTAAFCSFLCRPKHRAAFYMRSLSLPNCCEEWVCLWKRSVRFASRVFFFFFWVVL